MTRSAARTAAGNPERLRLVCWGVGTTRAIRVACLAASLLGGVPPVLAQETPPAAAALLPVLHEITIDGATVYGRPEIAWLLGLKTGQPLPAAPDALARTLSRRYAADGYACARVAASFDASAGRLVLRVFEGRIDAIEFTGDGAADAERLRARLDVRAGDVYNARRVDRALEALTNASGGALEASVARTAPPDGGSAQVAGAACPLVGLEGRRVLIVRVSRRAGRFAMTTGSREDAFSPVDGLVPSLGFRSTVFDARGFGRTFLTGTLAYRWARDTVGYTLGGERPFGDDPRIAVGAELHDLTATDDGWRLTTMEQSLVALAFHRSFRDYHERRGYQVFAAARVGASQEIEVVWRADREGPLVNRTDFSLFDRSHDFPVNAPAAAGRVRALVAAYVFDSRGTLDTTTERAFSRHVLDGFYGGRGGAAPGLRIDWTSEFAPAGLGGDFDFNRHVLDVRAYARPSPRQALDGRALFGFSGGTLPPQRTFALGGIGSVRGYPFKDVAGAGMALLNAEYEVGMAPDLEHGRRAGLRGLAFLDAGRVWRPLPGSTTGWLVGAGVGVGLGDLRVEFGWPLAGPSRPVQILVRFGRTF